MMFLLKCDAALSANLAVGQPQWTSRTMDKTMARRPARGGRIRDDMSRTALKRQPISVTS
jgi:hypothetical protein